MFLLLIPLIYLSVFPPRLCEVGAFRPGADLTADDAARLRSLKSLSILLHTSLSFFSSLKVGGFPGEFPSRLRTAPMLIFRVGAATMSTFWRPRAICISITARRLFRKSRSSISQADLIDFICHLPSPLYSTTIYLGITIDGGRTENGVPLPSQPVLAPSDIPVVLLFIVKFCELPKGPEFPV